MKLKEFEYLVDALKSLPGISTKGANKIAYYLLNSDEKYFGDFINRLIESKRDINFCTYCNNLTSKSFICEICKNTNRNKEILCIVTTADDLYKIESSNSFFGIYFVLKNELDYKNSNSAKNIDMDKIEEIINKFNIKEILFATNVTANGELTRVYIQNYLIKKSYNLDMYLLGRGIPLNSSIDYLDWESLQLSIKNKIKI